MTSTADTFPLQTVEPNGLPNGCGVNFLPTDHYPGSDESLGGALLTPIPWLSDSSVENDNECMFFVFGLFFLFIS